VCTAESIDNLKNTLVENNLQHQIRDQSQRIQVELEEKLKKRDQTEEQRPRDRYDSRPKMECARVQKLCPVPHNLKPLCG
jgi:hypothetical protein